MQVGFLCGTNFVGSEISWDKPSLDISSSISVPSGVFHCSDISDPEIGAYLPAIHGVRTGTQQNQKRSD